MLKNKNLNLNQNGHSPIVIIAVVVLISLIGFTIWRLNNEVSSNKKSDTSKSEPKIEDPKVFETPKEKQKFSQQTLNYFNEVAFGAEFNDNESKISKWEKSNVELKVNGTPSASDAICLDQVITDFNSISTETKLYITKGTANVNIYFAPEAEFKNILPDYIPKNMGYFSVNWTSRRSITKASILISTTEINDTERCHLIREETTQSMGIMKDSHSYSDSIFYDDWTYTTKYSDLDKQVIKLLYGGNGIKPSDDKATVASKVTVF